MKEDEHKEKYIYIQQRLIGVLMGHLGSAEGSASLHSKVLLVITLRVTSRGSDIIG